MRTPDREGVGALRALGIALGFGLAWYAVEYLAMVATDPDFDRAELARRALRFLPWHLLVFAGIGLAVAFLARLRALSAGAVAWLVLYASVSLFLGVRVAEGALHASTFAGAVLRTAGVGLGLAVAVALLAGVGRLLPERLRGAWPAAACSGAAVLAIALLRVTGPGISLGELGLREILGQVRPIHVGAAGLVAAVVLGGVALRGPRGGLAGALVWISLATPVPAGAESRRPDVFVFLLDTLRADHFGRQPDGSLPTPALAAVEPEFVRFQSAWSPSTRTSRSMPGIMASLSVRVAGAVLAPDAVTLAERLQEGGWSTFGVSANPLVSEQFGLAQGFDSLSGMAEAPDFLILSVLKLASAAVPATTYDLGIASAELFYPPIGQLRRRALEHLARSPGPAFVYVQTMDVHGPYLPPRRFLPADYRRDDFLSYYRFHRLTGDPALLSPELAPRIENLRQRYAGCVRHTDEELAGWIEDLRAQGRWDEALVWILSDHGEAFGEHGFAGHGHAYLGSPVVKVPMWLKLPRSFGIEPGELADTVSTYDVLPTTLGLLGLPPVEPVFGVDLSPRLRGAPTDPERTVVMETDDGRKAALYAAVRGGFKLDVHFSADGGSERRGLFDLARDAGETRDVAARYPEVADALEAAIHERRRLERELAFARRERKVDPQTRERLRALGYLDE